MKRFGFFVLALLLAFVGIGLLLGGFSEIQELRQLERVPASKAGDILAGEVNITATAAVLDGTIRSFHTKTPSLYYRYTHEVRTTDSEGETRWDTVDIREECVDFLLQDDTGAIVVKARNALHGIDWWVRERFQTTIGDDRYTEWRIHAGERLFVFAKAVLTGQDISLSFTEPGYYTPIISAYGQGSAQTSMGTAGVFLLWIGLVIMGLTVIFIMFAFNVHRLLVYLSLLTVTLMSLLMMLSHVMMYEDISNGLVRHSQQIEAAEAQIAQALQQAGMQWQGWADAGDFTSSRYAELTERDRERFKAYRINITLGQLRLQRQMQAKPERWLIKDWGFEIPPLLDGIPEQDWQSIQERLGKIPNTRLDEGWIIIVWLVGIGTAVLTFFGYWRVKTKRLIENIPTSLTTGVSYGLAELCGTVVKHKKQLMTPYNKAECIWYFYHEQEKRGSGKNAKWVTITKETRSVPFDCEDREGRIRINPDGAEVITSKSSVKISGRYRYTEKLLAPNDPLYAIGMANIDAADPDRLIIEKPDTSEPFILSNYTEAQVMLKKAHSGMWYFNFAFNCMMLALLLWFGIEGGFAATDFLFASLAAPLYMILIMLILHYNDLIYLRQRARRNWSNIDVSLKKRYDLMKTLETIIQRYLSHEKSLHEQLALLRSSFSTDDKAQIARYLDNEQGAKNHLIALLENYPDLKANQLIQQFMTTQSTLATEVALYRQGYNDAVELYNTRIGTLPDIIFARLFGFRSMEYVR